MKKVSHVFNIGGVRGLIQSCSVSSSRGLKFNIGVEFPDEKKSIGYQAGYYDGSKFSFDYNEDRKRALVQKFININKQPILTLIKLLNTTC